jgi:hypothetical protein
VCYDDPGRIYGTALPECNIHAPVGKESTMEDKGFFGALFDLSFSEFVTIKFIRFLYIIFLLLIAIGFVIGLLEFTVVEAVQVDDEQTARLQVSQVDLQGGGIHGHEDVGSIARRVDV